MPIITFLESDGQEHVVDAKAGLSVMAAAVRNNVPGIDADCGGACACATCHVYIDNAWVEATGRPSDQEASMLEFADDVRPTSRLSCQISLSPALDGMIVRLPEEKA
ncbi:Ferredoxin-6 [Brevundimonas subvibrioides]|uniref:2Fe-2S iron-sulfur cluster-binding protein n=1 Tax=Brevundimonas subvibrioides TaxID=74313 RepID=UPI0032D5AA68